MRDYDFGPRHPLKPERLRRTLQLLEATVPEVNVLDPGDGLSDIDHVLRVHSGQYVHAVQLLSQGETVPEGSRHFGFGNIDNPLFPGIFEASLAYTAGAVRAAEAVNQGARVAYSIAGGLHHAMPSRASGFCVFNDPAIAVAILRDQFDRVAYIDIDLHHGDGVETIFWEDPAVLTCSIHETGDRLFPRSGYIEDTGPTFTAVNVPLLPETTGDVWLTAFRETILPALTQFEPQALVVQMGTDPHFKDPLGHLRVSAQEWREAVADLRRLNLPSVVLGGGGYDLTCVPRMWVAAIHVWADLPLGQQIPDSIPAEWGMKTFDDPELPHPRGVNQNETAAVIARVQREVLPNIPALPRG